MAQQTVASAVVLPETSPSPRHTRHTRHSPSPTPSSTHAGSKRRQSSTSHASPKRQRLSPSPNNQRTERNNAPLPRAKPIDERKRNQRLFSALLGGIGPNRPSNTAAAKRRAEQEDRRRQKEQELSERQKSRLEAFAQARNLEQRRVDESDMRIRHQNMRAMANFLVTSAEPKLYYRPWELLPEHQEQIDRQHDDVDAQIDRELDDFDQIRQTWTDEDQGRKTDLPHSQSEHTQAEPRHVDHSLAPAPVLEPEPEPESVSGSISEHVNEHIPARHLRDYQTSNDFDRQRNGSIDDATGDIVVEAEEDTVIY